jgi:hypothetical protein
MLPAALLTVAATAPVASSAVAHPSTTHAVPRPTAGHWKWQGGSSTATTGTLTVTKHGKKIRHLSIVPGQACRSGKRVTVLGSHTIKAHGLAGAGGQWHVGKTTKLQQKVNIRIGKRRSTAELSVNFNDKLNPAEASTSLIVSPTCGLEVTFLGPTKK